MSKTRSKPYLLLAAAAAVSASALLIQPAAAGEGGAYDARYEAYVAAEEARQKAAKTAKPVAQRQSVRVGAEDATSKEPRRNYHRFHYNVAPEKEQLYRG